MIDLRLAPHFDLATLSRASAFALFAELSIRYVDGALPLMAGKGKSVALDGVRAAVRTATGPLVFLASTPVATLASVDEVRRILFTGGRSLAGSQMEWLGPS